jgi:hypothetical protein
MGCRQAPFLCGRRERKITNIYNFKWRKDRQYEYAPYTVLTQVFAITKHSEEAIFTIVKEMGGSFTSFIGRIFNPRT